MIDPREAAEAAVIHAAHHAFCKDTGCFDGDDISGEGYNAVRAAYRQAVAAAYDEGFRDGVNDGWQKAMEQEHGDPEAEDVVK